MLLRGGVGSGTGSGLRCVMGPASPGRCLVLHRLKLGLRGGNDEGQDAEESLGGGEWGTSDEDIIGEGTGEAVSVQQSIVDKLKAAPGLTEKGAGEAGGGDGEENIWAEVGLDKDDPLVRDPIGTLADMRQDREDYYAEFPDAEVDVNETMLFEVRCENLTETQAMLHLGADVNYVDEEGDCALHIAALTGNATIIDFLVGAGAKLDIGNNESNTPLHYAAEFGQEKAIRALVGHGANISARNE